jgi:hypothetical protein
MDVHRYGQLVKMLRYKSCYAVALGDSKEGRVYNEPSHRTVQARSCAAPINLQLTVTPDRTCLSLNSAKRLLYGDLRRSTKLLHPRREYRCCPTTAPAPAPATTFTYISTTATVSAVSELLSLQPVDHVTQHLILSHRSSTSSHRSTLICCTVRIVSCVVDHGVFPHAGMCSLQ